MYLAGALVGAAMVIRQLSAPNLLLICAVPLFWRGTGWPRRLASSFSAALGFATIAGLLVYFFVQQGTLRDFWFWTVYVVGQRYLPDGWHYTPPLHQLGMLAETVVFWNLIVLRARRWQELSFTEKAIGGWLVLSLAIVIFPGRFHPHYAIQAFAPMAILSALEFGQRLEEARETKDWRLIQWSAGLLAALTLVFGTVAWAPVPRTQDAPELTASALTGLAEDMVAAKSVAGGQVLLEVIASRSDLSVEVIGAVRKLVDSIPIPAADEARRRVHQAEDHYANLKESIRLLRGGRPSGMHDIRTGLNQIRREGSL